MYLIVDPSNPANIELKQVFSSHLDMNETVGKRRFSDLHKIVLGLTATPVDLEAYLQVSTAEIEARCSLGRTPSMWAVTSSNAHAIKLLLKYGVKLDGVDHLGNNVLHRTTSLETGDTTEALRVLLEAAAFNSNNHLLSKLINQPNNEGTRPLDYACLNGKPKQVALLLSYNASPEFISPNPEHLAPIFYAIDNNHHEVIRLLLAAGAKTDVKDNMQKSILHITAEDGDLETIEILAGARPRIKIETEDRDVFGMTPIEVFEKHEENNFAERDEGYRVKRRKAFSDLLEQVERSYLQSVGKGEDLSYCHSVEEVEGDIDRVHTLLDLNSKSETEMKTDSERELGTENLSHESDNDGNSSNSSDFSDENELFFDAFSDLQEDNLQNSQQTNPPTRHTPKPASPLHTP